MDEIERLKQQHREELDLAQEVIVNLRRDLAHAHKRIESQDAVWNDAISTAFDEAKYILALVAQDPVTSSKVAEGMFEALKRPMA